MKTVLVTYHLPGKPPRAVILERFIGAANNGHSVYLWESQARLPGLLSKQFCYDETTGNGHSVYLWESQARAEEFFSPAFTQHFREAFGVEPTVTHLDILVLVDNRAGGEVVAN